MRGIPAGAILGPLAACLLSASSATTLAETPQTASQQAAAAEPAASLRQGDLYLKGEDGTADTVAAIAAFEKAADQGSIVALVKLGALYGEGKFVSSDPAKALVYYRKAAEAGNQVGKLRVGEMTARGLGTPQDIEWGRALVREVADEGNVSALVSLGDLYSRGDAGPVEAPTAVAAYEKAAAQGSVVALLRLGTMYRDGNLVDRNTERAHGYFQQASAAGSVAAQVAIGKGYLQGQFGDIGSGADGIRILEEADRAGATDAVLVLSDSYLYGRGARQDPKNALLLLQTAMDSGNVAAARRLVAIYRDGRGSLVKRDPPAAKDLLLQIRDRLDVRTLAREDLLLDASLAGSIGAYQSVHEGLAGIVGADRPPIVRQIRGSNPNAFVFLVQARLAELGMYAGRNTGLLDRSTIRAIMAYCAEKGQADTCRQGPLTAPVSDILSQAF